MAELSRASTVSRSALLELRDELRLVEDGYEFLDEKRILLAAEMLRQRDTWLERNRAFTERFRKAADSLIDAAAEQGLDGLEVCPPTPLPEARVDVREQPYVGQVMLEASFAPGEAVARDDAIRPTPRLDACRDAFLGVLEAAAELAASTANVSRLMHEYRRTERRVRALENVVLPEIHTDITVMEEHLDLVEQEEVVRVRLGSDRTTSRTHAG